MFRLLSAALLASCLLSAQTTTGTLLGTVKDSSGAVIPSAKVRVTNQGTGISVDTITNGSGDYVVPNLAAAVYAVQAEAPGFRTVTVSHVRLLLNATVRTDVRLEPGVVEQTLTVAAEAPVVNSETASVASVVDEHSVQTLPLNGRTLDYLVLLTAGNTSDSASNPRLAGSLYWGGNYYSVDGVTFNDTGNGGAAYSYQTQLTTTPSVDTVQEVKVEANNAKAENEGSAAVSMITRSGTNQLHGSLYEYNRNRALTAKNFFATSQPKPAFNRNEFGGTVNGPVLRNRTFFFGSYEGLRQRTARPPFLSLPTATQREGNFGKTTIRDPLSGTPFPGSRIPQDRIDPRATRLLDFVPLPNIQAPGYNYVTNVGNVLDVNRYSLKLDHKLATSSALSASLSYSIGSPYFVTRGTPANYGNFSDAGYITKTAGLTFTRSFGGSINDFRYAYFSHASVRLGQNTNFNPATIFPTLYQPLPVGGLPNVTITGYAGISDYGGGERAPQITIQLTDNYTFIRGPHTFKTGFDIAFIRLATNPSVGGAAFGQFTFNGRYTGNAFADFLLGYPVTSARETATQVNLLHQARYSLYFQDDWKVTPKLTLNLGLRYMLQSAMQERDGSWSNFDFSAGRFVIRSADGKLARLAIPRLLAAYPYVDSEAHGWGSDLLLSDPRDIEPRFGFAWRPFGGNKTVVRGGYGLFYSQIPAYIGIRQISLNNSPFFLHETFEAAAGTTPSLSLADPFPTGAGQLSANPAITAVNRQLRNALSQQWNFTLERQVLRNVGLRLTYLGNKATHVPWYNYNRNLPPIQTPGTLQAYRPYQPWSDITTLDTNGNAFTNQFQAELQRRLPTGLYLMANYTWNKTLDNVPTVGTPQDPYNARLERGNGDGIRQHVFNLAATYPFPFGPGKRLLRASGLAGKLIGGWNLAGIANLRSGSPFSIVFTPKDAGWYATRANAVGDPFLAHPTIEGWFNAAAFATPAPFTFGDSARNLLFGPGQVKIDVSMLKDTKIFERYTLQFRAESFNFPNHASFANPSANISFPSTVGKIRSTSVDQRVVQFAMKLVF